MDIVEFEGVEELGAQFSNMAKFWRGIEEWERLSLQWLETPFSEINVESLQKEVTVYYKIVNGAKRTLQHNQAVAVFFDKVLQFKNVLPVVQALRNPALD